MHETRDEDVIASDKWYLWSSTYKFQFCPLAVEQESCYQEGEQSKDGCSSAYQPEIMLQIHEHKEQIYHNGPKGQKHTIHFQLFLTFHHL